MMLMTTIRSICSLLVWTLAGCQPTDLNRAHCSLREGDATCAELHDNLPFCNAGCGDTPFGDGCVAEVPSPEECYSPCGQGLTAEQLDQCPASASGTAESTTASSTTSDTAATVADDTGSTSTAACAGDAECESPTPLCREGQCVPCSLAEDPDSACAERFEARPLCVEGRCVQCTAEDMSACVETTPVCDDGSGECVGCSQHEQCPASACNLQVGSCLPEDRVWWVDADALGCLTGDGSEAAPYCTLAAARANIGAGEQGTIVLRSRMGGLAYPENLTINAGRVVALRAASGPAPRIGGTGVGAPVTVSGGGIGYVEGIRVDGSVGSVAVQVVGAVLDLRRATVVLNPGGAIGLSNGAELTADNTVLGANGSALVDAQALRVTDSSFALRYVTVAGNDSSGIASISCTGSSGGTLRNSIVAGLDPGSIACPGLEVQTSAVDTMLEGQGVVVLGPFDPGWFQAPGAGDFHVTPGHPFVDVARWELGDPPVDLDGDLRPERPGTPDVAGADL